jgi:hypothetical protein
VCKRERRSRFGGLPIHTDPNLALKDLLRKRRPGENEARQLEQLLGLGANPNLEVARGRPVLIACIHRAYPPATIRLLLARGADSNGSVALTKSKYKLGEGQSALAIAACSIAGREAKAVVKELVQAGSDLNLKDSQGNTVVDHLFAVIDYYRSLYRWDQVTSESEIRSRIGFFFNFAGPIVNITNFLVEKGALTGSLSREEVHQRFSDVVQYWNQCVSWSRLSSARRKHR